MILVTQQCIPNTFEGPTLLASYTLPNHSIQASSTGLVNLPPRRIGKSVRYMPKTIKSFGEINTKGGFLIFFLSSILFILSIGYSKEKLSTQPNINLIVEKKSQHINNKNVSLNFQDIEVRAVLQILADLTGLNIVVSDSVKSRLTIRLIDVPWEQALNVILKIKNLSMSREGSVIYIAQQSELQEVETLAPLSTYIIQINYAKAEEISKVLSESNKKDEIGNSSAAGLSSRGSVSFDPRTNHLIIYDTQAQMANIRKLIGILDQPIQQVQIDAKVIIANDSFARNLGVKWGGSGVQNGIKSADGESFSSGNFVSGSGADRTGINLAAAASTSNLAIAILRKSFLLELELSAMQTDGRGETLASPRIFTADRQTAYIKSGRQVAFNKLDEAGNTTSELKEVVLQLTVTPQITPDKRVILDLTITKDDLLGSTLGDGIAKNEIKTQAIVSDGETVVLGGVYTEINSETIRKVPFLSDIPFLGKMFKNTNKRQEKAELLIFVTPRIVKQPVKQKAKK